MSQPSIRPPAAGLEQPLQPWSRVQVLLLVVLVVGVFAWGLTTILLDRRYTGSDNFVESTLVCHEKIQQRSYWPCVSSAGRAKGPLPSLLALPLLLALGNPPASIRLLSLLAHCLLILQSCRLAYRLRGAPSAGLWAALLCGTSPLLLGLCRLTHHDVVLAVIVLLALQLMLFGGGLDEWRHAEKLALIVALGLITKPLALCHLATPAEWFVARRLRSWRALGNTVLATLLALVLLLPNYRLLLRATHRAYLVGAADALPDKLLYYARLPGFLPLLGLAVLFAGIFLVRRLADGWTLSFLFMYVPMLLALVWLTPWSRYVVPVLPVLAVVVGVGLSWLQSALPGRKGPLAAAALLLLLCALTAGTWRWPAPHQREQYAGMILPDRRTYDAYPHVARALLRHDRRAIFIYLNEAPFNDGRPVFTLWRYRGVALESLSLEEAMQDLRQRRPVSALVLSDETAAQRPELKVLEDWFHGQPRRTLIAQRRDPDGITYSAYRILPDR